ncbi:MAG: 2OG-Fe(II) oxygenase [Burkholderiales bacterium]|nr:2OG-Fe(II) oxygenase [Burkholderiales bacterium]
MLNATAFAPVAGATEWWEGDGNQFAEWDNGMPHPALSIRRRLLSAEQCRLLVDCYERNRGDHAPVVGNPYWDGRCIYSAHLPDRERDALRIMQQVRHLATLYIMERFSPARMVYSDTAQLVRWHPGLEMTAHADNLHPDGRPNVTGHRHFSSILYLNDDYDGGHTFFPGFKMRLRPEAGTLVMFGAGPEYVHGVTRLVRGLRYTYAGWFTHDRRQEDATANRVY